MERQRCGRDRETTRRREENRTGNVEISSGCEVCVFLTCSLVVLFPSVTDSHKEKEAGFVKAYLRLRQRAFIFYVQIQTDAVRQSRKQSLENQLLQSWDFYSAKQGPESQSFEKSFFKQWISLFGKTIFYH